ncbi:MAG: phage major capsid protein [Butyrivibrio sp.]|nr:phage major capsid protein [Acetatifactor muris]MCM1560955.1 phage major capsid protein [Butyrivibrio sp.]
MEKRLKEIQERAAAILKEMEEDLTEERLAELEEEQRALETEKSMLQRKLNVRGRLKDMAPEEDKPEAGPAEDDREARAAKVQESGRLTISAEEVRNFMGGGARALTLATGSLTQPTDTGKTIRDNMEGISSIVDQVYTQDLTGLTAYEEPYVVEELTAGMREDGKAQAEAEPKFAIAMIQPADISVTAYVSKNIKRLNPVAYEEKVRAMALKALRRKLAGYIANGDGKNFFGIKTAENKDKEKIYKTLNVNTAEIKEDTLRNIVFSYGGSEEIGAGARLYLTKEDLSAFGQVRGKNEKKPVYEITADPGNANCGTIKDGGTIVPYTLLGSLQSLSKAEQGAKPVQTMLYGDPRNFEVGLFGDYTIEVSRDYKFAEGLLTIMGEVMVGGNLIVHEGFVVVTLTAKGQNAGGDNQPAE